MRGGFMFESIGKSIGKSAVDEGLKELVAQAPNAAVGVAKGLASAAPQLGAEAAKGAVAAGGAFASQLLGSLSFPKVGGGE